MSLPSMERREFLKLAGAAAVATASSVAHGAAPPSSVQIVIDPADAIASSAPVEWAVRQLRRALTERGSNSQVVAPAQRPKEAKAIAIVLSGMTAPAQPESLRIVPSRTEIAASGADIRGLVYAVLELADRVNCSTDKSLGLSFAAPIEESPANPVRSAQRAFCSELEDKPWYYDRTFWTGYLDMLAANRFNRFNLAFGFGYDFPKGVTDDYFHFPYPYLLDVPGYDVRAVPLAAGERERNFEIFRFIATETAARGLHFQLGIWTHACAWTDSPNATHHIEGLTAENHARYCRDALALLLKECPEIQGLTMRVHGESGIPEGSYPFWETLFEAIAKCGRPIELDMHAKGINQIMIDMAVKTGAKIKVSPKYSAEHMGLGYHQADIRELEIPRPERMETGVFSVSNGDRRFTRYGYADLYQQDRKFDILFRLWPGTQRHLLWGDPETAAAYARTAHFCGASGLELCEPLTFKGREGSGLAGGRCAYADATLAPKQDWEKFAYTYRLWGRLLYNPDCDPDVWRRWLRQQFSASAGSAESALAHASRILPLITTTHMVSASNHSYWPEIYMNMPILIGSEPSPYSDTPTPRCFGTVSPLDPQLFSTVAEFADDLLAGRTSPKYSPIAVATWLEDMASSAAAANGAIARSPSVELARWQEDVWIQVGLGRFFASRLRSGLAWEIYRRTGSAVAAQQAVARYTEARDAWAAMAQRASTIYVTDITYGRTPERRGDWTKRLPGIDRDLAAMRAAVAANSVSASGEKDRVDAAVAMIAAKPQRGTPAAKHVPASAFRPGEKLDLHLELASAVSVTLAYRHVNQGERWQAVAMSRAADGFSGSIPGSYTRSPYPLQYYFVVAAADRSHVLFPGFDGTLSNQPYYAVWRRQS